MSGTSNPQRYKYKVVTSSTPTPISVNGQTGDFLHSVVLNANGVSTFLIRDNTTNLFTLNTTSAGLYVYEFNIASQNGGWYISCNNGTIIGIGTFTN